MLRGGFCERRKGVRDCGLCIKQLPRFKLIAACGADDMYRVGAAAIRFGREDARLQRAARQQRAFGVQGAGTDKPRVWCITLFLKDNIGGVNQNLPHFFMRERGTLGEH